MNDISRIREALLDYGETVSEVAFFSDLPPEVGNLLQSEPYAFMIATCLMRGSKAEVIYSIPYYMKQALGHLDPVKIHKMSPGEIRDLICNLPALPRYIHDAPRTILEFTQIIVEECNGDTEQLWKGKTAAQVNRTLQSIHGVGSGIANMGVLLIEDVYGKQFDDLDRSKMDIKSDVHTMRVLYRLGVSEKIDEESATRAARLLNPEFPGKLDLALWNIGRNWCKESSPICNECPMKNLCNRNHYLHNQ